MLFFFRKARLQRLSRSLTTQRARQWTRRRLRTECTSSVLRTSRLSADRRNTSPSLSSMKSQDGQAQLRQTGFRWIKAYALLEPLQQLRGHILIIRKRLLQLWVCSIDTLRRLIQAMQSLWPRRSTFHIIAWLGAHENMGALGNLSAGLLRP